MTAPTQAIFATEPVCSKAMLPTEEPSEMPTCKAELLKLC